jgi:hypothetical protein
MLGRMRRSAMPLSPQGKWALKVVATVLFLGHMLATSIQHIPRESALRPAAEPFVAYQALTGIWQDWDMFITIPYLHSYDVALDVGDGEETSTSYGPMLPGLRAYDGDIRSEGFFTRVLEEESFTVYREAYFRSVCAALRASSGKGGQTLVFRETFERIRPLSEIRAGGTIGKRDEHKTKFACE